MSIILRFAAEQGIAHAAADPVRGEWPAVWRRRTIPVAVSRRDISAIIGERRKEAMMFVCPIGAGLEKKCESLSA